MRGGFDPVYSNWLSRFPERKYSVCMPKMPLTPEQQIKELKQPLFESENKAQFLEAVVKVIKSEFSAALTKKSSQPSCHANTNAAIESNVYLPPYGD
ncbi:hypothetical protein AAH450_01390 [Erwinia sp. P7711]|uniref:hypothetical protein n=1 Tax=Erwinia sp. P7711 TaxID=3141451 RepID=UPI00318892F6